MKYTKLVGLESFMAKKLVICPFCGMKESWLFAKKQGFLKNKFYFKCAKCNSVLSIYSMCLPIIGDKKYLIEDVGRVNNKNFVQYSEYSISEFVNYKEKTKNGCDNRILEKNNGVDYRVVPNKIILTAVEDYCCIDIETTGLDAKHAEIIEVAIVKIRNGQINNTYERLIKPRLAIGEFITNLTGITNKMVEDSHSFEKIAKDIIDFVGDDILIGHNIAAFDIKFLNKKLNQCGYNLNNDIIDTLHVAKKVYPNYKNYKLETIKLNLNIHSNASHRALDDCKATIECYELSKYLLGCESSKVIGKKSERKQVIIDEDQKNKIVEWLNNCDERKYVNIQTEDAYELNLKGIEFEKELNYFDAVVQYESACNSNFEGNHPYDRLLILYRKMKLDMHVERILKKAIYVFENIANQNRADVPIKLQKYKLKFEKLTNEIRKYIL